ncbi:MAG: DMT family transporter [Patescibacteria group bacterium]
MALSKDQQGELFIFAEATLWSFFPIITILSYSKLSPLISLAGSTLFAALFFAIFLAGKNKWQEIKDLSVLGDIILATLFIGILYYFLIFTGLKYTTAGNASIISLAEVFFSFLFFNIWKKEYLSIENILGAILMVLGAVIVLFPGEIKLNLGDLLVLAATIVAPFGNFFQRRARTKVSSETIMFIRSIIVAPLIFLLALLLNPHLPSIDDFRVSLVFLIINGFFLFGLSKVFWLEGIHRIPVAKANALSSISPLLTIFFAWLILRNTPTIWQFLAFIPLFIGTLLLTKRVKFGLTI